MFTFNYSLVFSTLRALDYFLINIFKLIIKNWKHCIMLNKVDKYKWKMKNNQSTWKKRGKKVCRREGRSWSHKRRW